MKAIEQLDTEQLLKGLTIPSCPDILTSLMQEIRAPDANLARVTVLIGQDVGLAAGVIKAANSPVFGARSRIASIQDGVSMLGLNRMMTLVTAVLLRSSFNTAPDDRMDRFWESAGLSATACARIATLVNVSSRDTAYLFGLFHDCGIPVLMRRYRDYRQTLQAANASRNSFTDIEDTCHNTNHAVVGYLLARNWGLPEAMAKAVYHHHDYAVFYSGIGLPRESLDLIGIALIAEEAVNLHLRSRAEREWTKGAPLVSLHFGLSEDALSNLLEDIVYELGTSKPAFV